MYACHDGLIHNLRLDHYLDTKWTFHKQNYVVLNIQFLRENTIQYSPHFGRIFRSSVLIRNLRKK